MNTPSRGSFARFVFAMVAILAAFIVGRLYSNIHNVPNSSVIVRRTALPPAKTYLSRDEAHKQFIELMDDATSAGLQGVKRLTQFATSINPQDIPDLMASALSLPESRQRDIAFDILIKLWAHMDPQAAMNWALDLPAEDVTLFNIAIVDIGSNDPQLAESYLNQMTDTSVRDEDIKDIGAKIGISNPVAALDWFNQMATGVTYDTAVNNLFTHLTQPARSEQMTPDGKHEIIIATSGYKQDIPAAISLLDNLIDPSVRETAIATIATNWSNTDPNAALAWAQTLSDSDSVSALNSVVTIWSKTDPAAAAAYVQNSTDPAAFLSADLNVTQSLVVSSPQAALSFAKSLPEGDVKVQTLNNVLVSISTTDFATAWAAAAALPASDNPVSIMTNLVGTLANKDPAQAAELITQFPAGAAQDNAMATIAATWIQEDPQGFTVWLGSLSLGTVRDTAIMQLVSSPQAIKNPAGVLEWINTVSDPQTKAALLQKLTPTQ